MPASNPYHPLPVFIILTCDRLGINGGPAKLWLSWVYPNLMAAPAHVGRGVRQRLPRRVRVAVAGGGGVRAFAVIDTGGVDLPSYRLELRILATGVLVLNST